MATTVLPAPRSGRWSPEAHRPAAESLQRATATDPYAHKYVIAATVTVAAMLELIDTSIVNVAVPHMMGNLGATLVEVAWVSTGYIIANVIVISMSAWLSGFVGRRRCSSFSGPGRRLGSAR